MAEENEPGTRHEAEARLLQLAEEIQQLTGAPERSPDLGPKIDEAAELMQRISSLDTNSSNQD